MKDYRSTPLPKLGSGPVTGDVLNHWMESVMREVLAKADIRNPVSDLADGIVGTTSGGVTLGTLAKPTGRDVSVATLFTYIGDAGRAVSQRFAYPVQTANKNSVQSTSTVLTATSGASTSTVDVGAHSVKFDFGTVAYSAGSISGLTPETTYLIYASDPEYSGGAVTYLATTNPDNIIGAGNYYVGYVITPIAGTSTVISAATNAATVEFTTSTNHGWTSGQSVSFAGFTDANWVNFNTGNYVITVTAANKFTVATDTTAYGAYTTGATATRVTTSTTSGGGGGAGSGGGGSAGTRWDGLTNIP